MEPVEYADWVVSGPHPERTEDVVMFAVPRRARVRAGTYGGQQVVLELDVVARAPGLVCVRQERPGRTPWLAWVPSGDAVPLDGDGPSRPGHQQGPAAVDR